MTLGMRVHREWRRLKREARDWGVIAFAGYATIAFAVLALLAFIFLPGLLVDGRRLSDAALVKAENDARGSVLQLLGGLVVLVGAYLTARGVRLSRASHISDRFSKAVEQLGHGTQATRVGGVYACERIMRDASFEQRAVLETLVAFLREHRPRDFTAPEAPETAKPPPADAAAALRVIGRRLVTNDPETTENFGWNLTELDLREFSLRSGDFTGVNFWRSDLRRANLKGADLRRALALDKANLAGAVYDNHTNFPAGYKATEHGLRLTGTTATTPGEPVA